MKKPILVASLAAAALAGSLATQQFFRNEPSAPQYVMAQDQKFVSLTFAPVVRKATPAVVNISSERVIQSSRRGGGRGRQQPPGAEDFFERFFGGPGGPFGGGGGGGEMPERRSSGSGSGVIVSADGYVLTNNHVVENATEVKVSLSDRREFTAKIIGTDPQTDVAVLKIDATQLPVLPISDSTKVQIGDLALAVGNPFGIGQTVTMGIVGATGRSGLNPENYEDFIQTDAAINPGNSGGALINTNGQLIGINTAIISSAGGNQGIGFAIPINMAKEVMDQLVKGGKVTRGYIGAGIQDVTPELARAFKLPKPSGVAITQVEPGGPAQKAGVQPGDVVTEINGTAVADANELRLRVSRSAPGSTLKFKIDRAGQAQELPITLATRKDAGPEREGAAGELRGGTESPLSGVSVDALTPQIAQQLQLPSGAAGVVVTSVAQSSAASQAGLQRGDVIQQVNRRNVATVAEFDQAVKQSGSASVLLLVNRRGGTRFVVVEPAK